MLAQPLTGKIIAKAVETTTVCAVPPREKTSGHCLLPFDGLHQAELFGLHDPVIFLDVNQLVRLNIF
jgi:hypothetical protein